MPIEYMRDYPPDGRNTQCDECGNWSDGNFMIEVRKNWIVCEDCERDYMPCGHHIDSLQYYGHRYKTLKDFEAKEYGTTHWCAECEGEGA